MLDLHWIVVFVCLALLQAIFRPPWFFALVPALLVQPMLLTRFLDVRGQPGGRRGIRYLVENEAVLALLVASVGAAYHRLQ